MERVVSRISPGEPQRQEVQRAAQGLIDLVKRLAEDLSLTVEVRLVGSVAKDTYVHRPDIDVFIMFSPETPRKDMERYGLEIGRRAIGGEERYAEHPYTHGLFLGYEVDVVPCYAINSPEDLMSAVDRTPFHTEYVREHLLPRQKDQVRLLKQFMKGVGVYGAEARVQGFSGYLVELLVLRYHDFMGVINESSRWREGTVLSLEGMEGREFSTPLVFLDPVDKSRNVASALSLQSFASYVQACREFLATPKEEFFFPRPLKAWSRTRVSEEMHLRGTKLLAVRLKRPELTDDNLFPQVRKTLDGMARMLESGDFLVLDKGFLVRKKYVDLIIELQTDSLPSGKKHTGPPVTSEHALSFLSKWRGRALTPPYIENGRWMAIIERKHKNAKDLVKEGLGKTSLGNDMRDLENMVVLSHSQLIRSGPYSTITALLEKTFPWER